MALPDPMIDFAELDAHNWFVVARFGIFLEQLHLPQQFSAAQPHEFSPWFGAALIATGALVNLFSARRFMRLAGEVDRNQFADRSLFSR
jgi:putative membrane protein